MAGAAAEGDRLHQRVPAEAVGAVHRDARGLAGGVEPFDLGEAPVVGLDAAHVVVGAGPDRDRCVDRVDTRVGHRELARARQLREDLLGAEVAQIEEDGAVDAAAGLDLGGLGARDDVARGELERVRGVALHEALALLVDQVATLAAAALGDEDPARVHRRRVELHELHVLQRQPGAERHRHAVAGAGVRVRRRPEDPADAAGGEDHRLAGEQLDAAVHQVPRDDAGAAAAVDHEPEREELLVDDHAFGHPLLQLLVEHLDQDVPGDVGRVDGARRAGGTERPLVEPPVGVAREHAAPVLELVDVARRLGREDLDRVLVAEVVGALDRVERVLLGAVLGLVAEGGVDATLRRAGVAPRRMQLRDDGDLRAPVVRLDGGTHAGAPGADDEDVVGRLPCHGTAHVPPRPAAHAVPTRPSHAAIEPASARRPGVGDGLARVGGELLEVRREHPGQLVRLRVVGRGVAPGRARIEERALDPGHLDRHVEAEDLVDAIVDRVELARQGRVQQPAGRLDRHPVPLAERATRPARVHEPHGGAVLVELPAEHAGVDGRRLGQERSTEAGREGRLRLGDAHLGARELRGEAREEVEERLVARQSRDRRQDPERIGGQHHDRARVARQLGRQRVRDPLELVRGARVLGLRVVVEVDHAALVDGDVLEHRAERLRRLEDLGLRLGGEPDHLGVAATLDVEDTGVAPAVLVVTDQRALGVGREGRLARAREPEEDGDVAVLSDVRRAVHRQDALEREPVVHDREDRLLDLARVERAADQHLAPGRVEDDERAGAGAVGVRVGLDGRRVQDDDVGHERVQLLDRRRDEHRLREERVIRAAGDHADADAMGGVGAGERVDDVERIEPAQMRDDLRAQAVEPLLGEPLVDVTPPDPILRAGLDDDELVLR